MGNPFAVVSDQRQGFTRNYGGTGTNVTADPYISGYHFIKFIPGAWASHAGEAMTGENLEGIASLQDPGKLCTFLAGACLAVTPPGGTLNKAEFVGLGGTKWSVPTNIDYGNTLTVKFLEFSWLPVLSIFHGWVKSIRDYRTGVTSIPASGSDYTKSEYAASMYYWTTKPDGKTVEYSAMYSGMFPTKDPQDLFTGDLTAVDKLEIDVEFNVDWIWHEDWVYSNCQDAANERFDAMGAGQVASDTPIEESDEEMR